MQSRPLTELLSTPTAAAIPASAASNHTNTYCRLFHQAIITLCNDALLISNNGPRTCCVEQRPASQRWMMVGRTPSHRYTVSESARLGFRIQRIFQLKYRFDRLGWAFLFFLELVQLFVTFRGSTCNQEKSDKWDKRLLSRRYSTTSKVIFDT